MQGGSCIDRNRNLNIPHCTEDLWPVWEVFSGHSEEFLHSAKLGIFRKLDLYTPEIQGYYIDEMTIMVKGTHWTSGWAHAHLKWC